MAGLAAVCGVAIVLFGLLTAGSAPTDVRLGIEVTCFVGGLVLCFLAVVLARLARLLRALDRPQAPTVTAQEAAADPS